MTTQTDRQSVPVTSDGDHDRFAHYILAADPGAAITEAVVTGKPIQALCGKVWVPSRDPSRYPICPQCREIKAEILAELAK